MRKQEEYYTGIKERVNASICLHYIQARIIRGLHKKEIALTDSLRKIAAKIGEPKMSPQQIKHHLGSLEKLGVIERKDGNLSFIECQ